MRIETPEQLARKMAEKGIGIDQAFFQYSDPSVNPSKYFKYSINYILFFRYDNIRLVMKNIFNIFTKKKRKSKSDRYVESYDIDWELGLDQHTLEELYYLNWIFFGVEYNELMSIWCMERLETLGDEGNFGRYIDYERVYAVVSQREKKINRILGTERTPLIGEFAIGDMVDWKKFIK